MQKLLAGGSRLITVTGPGGVGKTRLAIEVANRSVEGFEDGVGFVDLSTVRDPELVTSSIVAALELPRSPEAPASRALIDHLRDRRALVFLDNFEQVVDAAPEIGQVLLMCPNVQLLVTSRSALRLRGASTSSPWRLCRTRRRAPVRRTGECWTPAFELTDANAQLVAEICGRLEGLPLAIELAAARIRTLPAEAILTRLDDRLGFLTGGARDTPLRHRTLHATIDWSFMLLEPWEQGAPRIRECLSR